MSIMALKTRLRLSLVIPDSPGQSTSLEELRVTPGGIPRKIWHVLCSLPAQRALAWAIVLIFVAADIALVGQHALVRYQSYHADAFDLGNMDQAVWNTLHGHLLRFTNRGADWYGPPTRLGVHVEPILLLIAPLYLIYTGPETLLVLQTVALALGGIPLLLLGLRRLLELPLVAAAFVGAYLVTPEILGEALYDFHAVALATPLLLLALWALDARRYGWFVVAAALAAICKEEVALHARTMLQTISVRWQGALGRLPLPSQWIGPLVIAWLIASAAWNINATSALVRPFWSVGTHPNPRQAQINALLTSVPATASVAATDTLDPHLSDRYALYLLPDPQSYMADYVVIDLSDDIPANQAADQQMYAAMLVSGNYRIVGTAGQVVLLEHLSLQSPALQIQGRGAANERLFPGKHT